MVARRAARACGPDRGSTRRSASGRCSGSCGPTTSTTPSSLQNAVDYGLTGGIHSLDAAEIERWLERVEVGNAYVNRHTTGAIVRRQPFGGWKRSSVGRGPRPAGPATSCASCAFRRAARRRRRARPSARTGSGGGALRRRARPQRAAGRGQRAALPPRRRRRRARGPDTPAADVASLRRAAAVAGVPLEVAGPGAASPTSTTTPGGPARPAPIERLRLLAPADDALRRLPRRRHRRRQDRGHP